MVTEEWIVFIVVDGAIHIVAERRVNDGAHQQQNAQYDQGFVALAASRDDANDTKDQRGEIDEHRGNQTAAERFIAQRTQTIAALREAVATRSETL